MQSSYVDDQVSIITPAYNAARFIDFTMESVVSQTYENWQWLVVDDCSSDNTAEKMALAAQADPRIEFIKAPRNGGPASARNIALDASSGRYVAFLDSDDLWLPEKLQTQVDVLRNCDAVMAYTAYHRINESGSATGRVISVPESIRYSQLLRNTAILTSTAMIDRTRSGPLRMKPTYYDDFALWLEVLKRGGTATGINDALTLYRFVTGSVSHGKLKSARKVWRTYRDVEHLGIWRSLVSFAGYATNACLKYSRF